MRVKELIARLKLLDQEARVVVNMNVNEMANGKEARSVKEIPATHYTNEVRYPVWSEFAEYVNDDPDFFVKPEIVVDISPSESSAYEKFKE